MMKDTFKNVLSFEFWQKFGKALMVVIAVMPAAGLNHLSSQVEFLSKSVGGLSVTFTFCLP